MPRIRGLGTIDWYFAGKALVEVVRDLGQQWDEETKMAAFVYYEREDWTLMKILLRPDQPLTFVGQGHIGRMGGFSVAGKLPPELLRFQRLLESSDYEGGINLHHVEEGILIIMTVRGRVDSPTAMMRGIVRRLSRD